jgi:predicted nucleotidyltransferase component of viral defense system
MRKPLQNVGASVRARLLNLAKELDQPFELLLVRYTLERLLYRLSISKHRENFVLKGAMLMRHWLDDPQRPTRDLDLLGFGDSDPELTLNLFREIYAIEADDAVVFDIDGLAVDTVRDESGYSGLRLKTYATVDGARVRVVIDIGYGDATEPGLIDIELPVLLDQPAPNLRAYSYETVIAEKFQAMVALGLANTRLKDFYDIWMLAQAYEFNDDRLAQAIAATFARRKTIIPTERPRRADTRLRQRSHENATMGCVRRGGCRKSRSSHRCCGDSRDLSDGACQEGSISSSEEAMRIRPFLRTAGMNEQKNFLRTTLPKRGALRRLGGFQQIDRRAKATKPILLALRRHTRRANIMTPPCRRQARQGWYGFVVRRMG